MTSELIIYITAIFASGLTLISGFGLGTIMLPVFAIFFPVEIAVGMTAIVHVLNNMFKMGLIFKDVNWKTLLYFGVPGIFGAFLGAMLLLKIDTQTIWYANEWLTVKPLNSVIGFLMIFFAVAELFKIKEFSFLLKYILPPVILPGLVTNFIIDNEVTDLPEPDSPTMPIVSPLLILNEIPLTALLIPCSVLKLVSKFFTLSNISFFISTISTNLIYN